MEELIEKQEVGSSPSQASGVTFVAIPVPKKAKKLCVTLRHGESTLVCDVRKESNPWYVVTAYLDTTQQAWSVSVRALCSTAEKDVFVPLGNEQRWKGHPEAVGYFKVSSEAHCALGIKRRKPGEATWIDGEDLERLNRQTIRIEFWAEDSVGFLRETGAREMNNEVAEMVFSRLDLWPQVGVAYEHHGKVMLG